MDPVDLEKGLSHFYVIYKYTQITFTQELFIFGTVALENKSKLWEIYFKTDDMQQKNSMDFKNFHLSDIRGGNRQKSPQLCGT